MSRLLIAAFSGLLACNVSFAQAPKPGSGGIPGAPAQQVQESTIKATTPAPAAAGGCEAKAVGKDGKALAGAAKSSFMKKCEEESKGAGASAACESKAMGKDGKPLAGAAKASFVKKCEAESKGADATAACETKAVGKDGKALAGAAKSAFVKKCVQDAKG